jgi:hypothetical protein
MGVGGQRHAPAAIPPGITRYPFYRRLGTNKGTNNKLNVQRDSERTENSHNDNFKKFISK